MLVIINENQRTDTHPRAYNYTTYRRRTNTRINITLAAYILWWSCWCDAWCDRGRHNENKTSHANRCCFKHARVRRVRQEWISRTLTERRSQDFTCLGPKPISQQFNSTGRKFARRRTLPRQEDSSGILDARRAGNPRGVGKVWRKWKVRRSWPRICH